VADLATVATSVHEISGLLEKLQLESVVLDDAVYLNAQVEGEQLRPHAP
jgi:hypothetical protein